MQLLLPPSPFQVQSISEQLCQKSIAPAPPRRTPQTPSYPAAPPPSPAQNTKMSNDFRINSLTCTSSSYSSNTILSSSSGMSRGRKGRSSSGSRSSASQKATQNSADSSATSSSPSYAFDKGESPSIWRCNCLAGWRLHGARMSKRQMPSTYPLEINHPPKKAPTSCIASMYSMIWCT